jgi:hypothetical protein
VRKKRGTRAPVNQGIHPAHPRKAERLATHAESARAFEAVARQWIAKKQTAGTPDHLRQAQVASGGNRRRSLPSV